MTYGTEAIIPFELGFPTLRTDKFTIKENNRLVSTSLKLVEERREVAALKMTHYQQRLKQGYDKGVKLRPLARGDLVLRKVVGIAKNLAWGKLGPNWEGSYKITSMVGIEAYYLEDLNENMIPRPWNVKICNVITINDMKFSLFMSSSFMSHYCCKLHYKHFIQKVSKC